VENFFKGFGLCPGTNEPSPGFATMSVKCSAGGGHIPISTADANVSFVRSCHTASHWQIFLL